MPRCEPAVGVIKAEMVSALPALCFWLPGLSALSFGNPFPEIDFGNCDKTSRISGFARIHKGVFNETRKILLL